MARSLRPDIPSRRACNVLSQVTPGMADLNPAPGVRRSGPPPLGTLDQAPLGTFQANRALNGEQGVAARQRARLRHSASTDPTRVPSPHEWDPDAFPMDHDLFSEDFRGYSGMDTIQRHPVGRDLPFAGSARLGQNFGLEGGGTVILRGLGPVPPRSPVSDVHTNPPLARPSMWNPINLIMLAMTPQSWSLGTIHKDPDSSNIELGTFSFATVKKLEDFLDSGCGIEEGYLLLEDSKVPPKLPSSGQILTARRRKRLSDSKANPQISGFRGSTKLMQFLRTAADVPLGYKRWTVEVIQCRQYVQNPGQNPSPRRLCTIPLSPKSQPIPTILSRSCRFSNHQSAVMVAFDSILLILLSTASMVLAAPAPPTPPSTQSTQPTQPIEFDLSLRRVVANSKKTIFLEPDNLRPNEACSFQFMPATASDTNKHPITFEPEKEAFGTRWTLKRNTLKRLHPDNIKLGTLSFATAELQEQILGSTGTQQGQLADRGIEGPNLLEALSNWMETADGFRFTPEPSGIQDYTMLQELRIAKENPQRYENWDVEGKSFNVNTLLLSTMVID
ncbi:hypothetical protein EV361DRAFT_947378 [Lentinula raphanica]|nr:hypothetical protein EV361DRAFT_947378 [Lentinula raphanica]